MLCRAGRYSTAWTAVGSQMPGRPTMAPQRRAEIEFVQPKRGGPAGQALAAAACKARPVAPAAPPPSR
jgi:hypothetical protein